jgi:hypothetical protein
VLRLITTASLLLIIWGNLQTEGWHMSLFSSGEIEKDKFISHSACVEEAKRLSKTGGYRRCQTRIFEKPIRMELYTNGSLEEGLWWFEMTNIP